MPKHNSNTLKTLGASAFALAFAGLAGTAYAQVETETTDPEMTEMEMKETADDIAEDAEELSEAMDEWSEESKETMEEDAMMEKDAMMDEPEVMDVDVEMMDSDEDADVVTLDCPDGTVAQADGSCMMTEEAETPEE